MADLPESAEWTEGIYQLETSDPVLGGPEGIDNLQAKQLANRSKWLKKRIEEIVNGTTSIGKAAQLETARALTFKGAATGIGSFDGSADIEIALALANSGVTAGTFDRVAVNAQGLVTAGSNTPVVTVSTSRTLSSDELGLALIDSGAASLTLQLPPANSALGVRDVIVFRVDNSGNRLVVKASGTDRLKFHTHLSASGYPFLVLMGAGDWWHLRSDGAGSWWPIGRYDNTPLGRPVLETTTGFSPGGWVAPNGWQYNRAEWPWVWDHAQQSGMLTTEALRAGKEGCWTSGDGALTFRIPEIRGEFLRVLDDGRGADASRVAGSYQYASVVHGEVVDAVSSFRRMQNLRPKFFDVSDASDALAVATTVASATSSTQTANSTYFGAVRPRNIAFPGRIKLI